MKNASDKQDWITFVQARQYYQPVFGCTEQARRTRTQMHSN